MSSTLTILGYSQASMFLQRKPAPNLAGVISIHGHREFGVEATVPHRLDLTFDDVEAPQSGDPMSLLRATSRKRWAAENGLSERSPTEADAAAIIAFAERLRDVEGTLLCHCAGGMSRAPAAALICLAAWRGPGTEVACVREVIDLRRGATPHVGLVGFADQLLGRDGELLSALASAIR